MCEMCDGGNIADLVEDLDRFIDETGWAVQAVVPRPGHVGWAYTIGLAEVFGHPELLMVDHDIGRAGRIVNGLGMRIRDDRLQLAPGDQEAVGGIDVELVEVHPVHLCGEALAMWHALYADIPPQMRPRLAALQVRAPSLIEGTHRDMRARLDQAFARLPNA